LADIGLFLDGTQKLVNVWVLRQYYPDVTYWTCPSIKACEGLASNHANIGVVYTDDKKMKDYIRRNSAAIVNYLPLYTVRGKGFKLSVTEVTTVDGYYLLLLKLSKGRGKAFKPDITAAISNEIYWAYVRNNPA